MNTSEKLAKLENAIKAYRGTYHPKTKKWIRPPQSSAALGIRKWSKELGLDPEQALKDIAAFKTFQEMRTWIHKTEVDRLSDLAYSQI